MSDLTLTWMKLYIQEFGKGFTTYLKVNCFVRFINSHTFFCLCRFRMFQDGSVILKGIQDKNWIKIEKGQYCLDGVQNYGSRTYNYSGDPLDQILIACSTDPSGPTVPENKVVSHLLSACSSMK